MTDSEAAAKGDLVWQASSKVVPKSTATLEAEIDALMAEDDNVIDVRTQEVVDQTVANSETAHREIVQLVRETLAEAAFNAEDTPRD